MRSLTAVLSAAAVLAASVVMASTPAAAAPVSKRLPTGSYNALQHPVRTATNVAIPAHNAVTVRIAGGATGVSVSGGSVAVNISMQPPAQTGSLTAFRYLANRPSTANVEFTTGHRTSDFALVTTNVQSGGKARIYNNSAGPVSVTVDVFGSYAGSAPPGTAKGFSPVTPTRLISTDIGANGSVAPVLGGHGGLPTTNLGAVAVTFSEFSAQHAGYLAAGPYSLPLTPSRVLRWPGGGLRAGSFAIVPVDPDGQVTLANYSAGTMHLIADVVGYFNAGAPTDVGMLNTVPATRVLQASYAGRTTHALSLAGRAGVPKAGASAVVVTLTAGSPSASGSVLAYNPDEPRPTAASTQYAAGMLQANTAIVPLSASNKIDIYNNGAGSVNLTVDVVGWVLESTLFAPRASSSRYLDDLTGNGAHDTAVMQQHGAADAANLTLKKEFVLLDVGAQSRHAPLSTNNPGVALALTSPTVRLTYAQLVSAVQAYVTAFAAHLPDTATATIAVGTNNSGNFTDHSDPTNPVYPAAYRGQEWANRVIEQVDAPAGITVVGADDIENGNPATDGFDNSATRAQAWVDAYLAAHPANPGGVPDLIYNGSANGCPNTFGAGTATTPCADGWTLQQFVSLTHRGSRIGVLPQIYYAYMAIQWANIDRVSGNTLDFVGSLSEKSVPGSLVPPQSWASLYNALSTLVVSPSIPAATDIEPASAAGRSLERSHPLAYARG